VAAALGAAALLGAALLQRRANRAAAAGASSSSSSSRNKKNASGGGDLDALSPRAVDALLALLLAPSRSPAEEARLEALLLLLSQSQPPHAQQSAAAAVSSDADADAWRVVWTQKPLFWHGLAPLLGASAPPCGGGTAFSTAAGTLASTVHAGPLKLTAHGSFTLRPGSGAWGDKPVFAADVRGGEMCIGPLKLPLLLLGSAGAWQLVYADARLRVFRAPDVGLAVQVPAAMLPAPAEEAAAEVAPAPALVAPAGR
jgi:hypothetical protein